MIHRSRRRRRNPEVDCHEVGRVLQSYLDGNVDDDFAGKIADHLEACKNCGLELETYQRIKTTLAAKMPEVDPAAIERLRAFGDEIGTRREA